jgi:hypothetical protein
MLVLPGESNSLFARVCWDDEDGFARARARMV